MDGAGTALFLVEMINDYIQQVMITTTAQAVHIVCSEAVAGSLRGPLLHRNMLSGFQRICRSALSGNSMKKEDRHFVMNG